MFVLELLFGAEEPPESSEPWNNLKSKLAGSKKKLKNEQDSNNKVYLTNDIVATQILMKSIEKRNENSMTNLIIQKEIQNMRKQLEKASVNSSVLRRKQEIKTMNTTQQEQMDSNYISKQQLLSDEMYLIMQRQNFERDKHKKTL